MSESQPAELSYSVDPESLEIVFQKLLGNFGFKEIDGSLDQKERFQKILELVRNGQTVKGVRVYNNNKQESAQENVSSTLVNTDQSEKVVISNFVNIRYLGLDTVQENKMILLSHPMRDRLKLFFRDFCHEPKVLLFKDVTKVHLNKLPDFIANNPRNFVYVKIVLDL